jgi:hypothetical protein
MEMLSDTIIQDKINSVNDLPEGYTPNLNSKWELLQAGLKPKQNKKTILYYLQRASAVAAILFLIGGSGLLMIKNPTKPTASSVKITTSNDYVASPNVEPIHQVKIEKAVVTSSQKIKNTEVNKASAVVENNLVKTTGIEVVQPNSKAVQPTVDYASREQVAVITKRFEEVDFTTPILSQKAPTDVLVKAHKFKFKLGAGNNFQVNNHAEFTSVIGFKTEF